jgi:hypothetical protein
MQRIRLRLELMAAVVEISRGRMKPLAYNNLVSAIVNDQLHPAIRIDWDQVGRRQP